MALAEVTPTLPRALIEARARGAIEVALLSHERDVHVGAGAKRLAAQATTEYHDRFLIELIQNGHDAHPPEGRSGEIADDVGLRRPSLDEAFLALTGRHAERFSSAGVRDAIARP